MFLLNISCILLLAGKCFTSNWRKFLPMFVFTLLEYGGLNHIIVLLLVLWSFLFLKTRVTRRILQLFFKTTLVQCVLVNRNWFIKYIFVWWSIRYSFWDGFWQLFKNIWGMIEYFLFIEIGLLLDFLYGLYKLLYMPKITSKESTDVKLHWMVIDNQKYIYII